MGNSVATFTPEQLEAYEDCSFFTGKDVERVWRRYRALDPGAVPADMTRRPAPRVTVHADRVMAMPELKENPFKEQICRVFATETPGALSFDEFLDMFSVFSEAAPRDLKAGYAFRIYDWDGDGHLGRLDLEMTLLKLTRGELTEDEATFVVDKVLEEADLDDDGMLSFIEFEHVISRAPDFLNTFHIRI